MKAYLTLAFLLASTVLFSQKKDQIEILNANELVFIEDAQVKAQRLIGDVRFKHHGALMFCDSAYFYANKNKLTAFGNVRIQQADSVVIYGDRLEYDGESRTAVVSGETVRMVNNEFILTTDELVFDRKRNMSSYHTGGVIVSKTDSNTLRSNVGHYFTDSKKFFFSQDVVLSNEQYVMETDSMSYHTITKRVGFFGPTTIEGEDNFIYCEDGYYNTETEISEYNKNAYLISDGRKLEGNKLYYDRKIGFGKAIGDVQISDTAEGVTISGEKALLYEDPDSVVVTESALLTQDFGNDSLFLHADTFKILSDLQGNKTMKAFYGVRFYKEDLQGACDSMIYSFRDSTIHLFSEPVLWSDENQLTAEKIEVRTNKGKIHSIYMEKDAFIISEVDTSKYNQIKGAEMTGFFTQNELEEIKVVGSGQTIYYAQDDQEKFIGVNKAEANSLNISISDNEVKQITFYGRPDATMYPIGELQRSELRYEGFQWKMEQRPTSKQDIFDR